MKIRSRPLRAFAVAAGVVALVFAAGALAGHEPNGVKSYTGCLATGTAGGVVSGLKEGENPLKACTSGQVKIHLSGGDITGVVAGTGLTGGSVNGSATLSLATSYTLPQSCSNGQIPAWNGSGWVCSAYSAGTGLDVSSDKEFSVEESYRLPQSCVDESAYPYGLGSDGVFPALSVAKWNPHIQPDGSVGGGTAWECGTDTAAFGARSSTGGDVPDGDAPIGATNVPAGAYAIFAKVAVDFDVVDERDANAVACTLAAGADEDFGSFDPEDAQDGGVISMEVVHSFDQAGTILVRCQDDFGGTLDWTQASWAHLRFIAIRVGSISNQITYIP